MQRPGQDPVAKDDVPWMMKYAGRGLGTVGSISEFTINITYAIILFYTFFISPFLYISFNNFILYVHVCVCACEMSYLFKYSTWNISFSHS